ncbi:MAG: hypothetical protein L6422_01870 [Candidatus Marinimicrobia bacterium]|nr:hypothetical protein [Candidatus Neomarinimicrobiota bacterium]
MIISPQRSPQRDLLETKNARLPSGRCRKGRAGRDKKIKDLWVISEMKVDGIVKSIKYCHSEELVPTSRERIVLDWCVGLKRFFGRSSLRMTRTRLLPPKEGGQVITFYETLKIFIKNFTTWQVNKSG